MVARSRRRPPPQARGLELAGDRRPQLRLAILVSCVAANDYLLNCAVLIVERELSERLIARQLSSTQPYRHDTTQEMQESRTRTSNPTRSNPYVRGDEATGRSAVLTCCRARIDRRRRRAVASQMDQMERPCLGEPAAPDTLPHVRARDRMPICQARQVTVETFREPYHAH